MRIAIIGAGGHARVVADAALSARLRLVGFVDERSTGQRTLMGLPVVALAEDLDPDGFVVAIGDNGVREECFGRYLGLGLEPVPVVHASAILAPGVVPDPGSVVLAGAIVNVGARIGVDAIVNTGATIDHDCRIGPHAHIAPGCHLAGDVSVGTGALLGVGTNVVPGVSIGEWAVCGAGASVVKDVDARTTVVGVPAAPTGTP